MRYLLDTDVVSALRVRGRHPAVATRNTKHFKPLGVELVNPWI